MSDQTCAKRYHFTIKGLILYKAGKRTGVENNKLIHFNLSAGTYSIEDFSAKIKVAILQPPQVEDLKLIVPKHYTLKASNTIFIALGIPDKYLEKTTLIKSTLPPGSYKTSLDTLLPPKSLSLHCNQINKIKNKFDRQPSSLLARMHVCIVSFSLMHLVFLVLDTHRSHLNFKILDEKQRQGHFEDILSPTVT